MVKFDRIANLTVQISDPSNPGTYTSSFKITGLRVSFQITKSFGWSANPATVRVWNLSRDSRNALNLYSDQVTLEAGYARDGGTQILFIGQTNSVSHSYNMPEIVTTFELGDSSKYLNGIPISVSFAAGTPAQEVIKHIAGIMGVSVVEFAPGPNVVYIEGFQYTGIAREGIVKACALLNLQAILISGELYILPVNGVVPGTIYDVNQNTGMIGIPERFSWRRLWEFQALDSAKDGYKVNSTLIPSLRPGHQVNLTSSHLQINQIAHRVETVRHAGDTYGAEWITQMELTRL